MSEPTELQAPASRHPARSHILQRKTQRSPTHRERRSSGKSAVPTKRSNHKQIQTGERVIQQESQASDETRIGGRDLRTPREGRGQQRRSHQNTEEKARRGRQPPESEPRARKIPGQLTTRSAQRHRQQEADVRKCPVDRASLKLGKPGSLYFKREKVSMTQRKICID